MALAYQKKMNVAHDFSFASLLAFYLGISKGKESGFLPFPFLPTSTTPAFSKLKRRPKMNTATFPCRVSQSRAVTELGHGTTLLGVAQIKILLEAEGAPMLQLIPVLEGEKKKNQMKPFAF